MVERGIVEGSQRPERNLSLIITGVEQFSGNPTMDSSDKTPPSKRLNASGGISSLPVPLMVHILSFLGIRDRIKTGVLSRSWYNLWTCVPDLSFRHGTDGPRDGAEFVKVVEKTLIFILSNGSRIKSFQVSSPNQNHYIPSFNVWTLLAATNGIEKFELHLSERRSYCLPQYLFRSSSFRELRFSNCDVYPSGPVSWKSLKKLSITEAHFGDHGGAAAIKKILAGAPVLEVLELIYPRMVNSLHLGNSSVKKLILRLATCDGFELSAPNLQSLQISGFSKGMCKLVNPTSLVEASVVDMLRGGLVQGLVENLLHVETLAIGTVAIEEMSKLYPKGLLLKCKSLTVDTHLLVTKPLAIASLLESCPELEMLIITMSDQSKHMYMEASLGQLQELEDFLKSQSSVFNGLKLLKIAKLVGFWDYRAVAFLFAEFLLEKASILQKLIVNMKTKGSGRNVTAQEISKVIRMLSSMPRASCDAEIVVY